MTLRALRFYEDKGLISPERNGTARIYSAADHRRLEYISLMTPARVPLDDIRHLIELTEAERFIERNVTLAARLAELEVAAAAQLDAISSLRRTILRIGRAA